MNKKQKGGIHRRGDRSFRISYYDAESNRQWETITGDTRADAKAEAERVLAVRLGDIARGIPVSSKPNVVLLEELAADVVNHYEVNNLSSQSDIDGRYRLHILPLLGRRRASQITTAQLNHYILIRRREGAKTGTINRELEAIRRCYKLAMGATPQKATSMPKIPMLEENNVRKGFFEREQLEAVCRHLPKHLVPVVRFGYITGWRYNEVVTRCWRHIDFKAGEVRLDPGETKNHKGRTFPMVAELRQLLEGIRPKGKLFPNTRVLANSGQPIGRFDKAWSTACRKAGLPVRYVEKRDKGGNVLLYVNGPKKGKPKLACRAAVYFHDFRRTAYRNLLRLGVPPTVARAAVGWLDAKTADRYDITSQSDLQVLKEKYDAANPIGAKSGANRTKAGAATSA